MNLAVAPKPWLDWSGIHSGKPVKAVKESDGLWQSRLHATNGRVSWGGEPWWRVRDRVTARLAADDMAEQLQTSTLPLLERLLDRAQFIKTVRGGDLGFAKSPSLPAFLDWALLVLPADEAESLEFDALGGFKRSSQHLSVEVNDGSTNGVGFNRHWAAGVALTGPAAASS